MKRFFIITIIVICIIAVAILLNGVYCNNTLEISNYEIKNNKNSAKLHFVFISDLHNKEFGDNNADLVNKIKEQNPDFITLGGDFVTKEFVDDTCLKNLLTHLVKIAPTYCVLGNHELGLLDELDIKSDINNTGAILLDNESIVFEKDGEKVSIGGLSDFPYYEFNAPDYDTAERYFWEEYANSQNDAFAILLHHQPEYIGSLLKESSVDLVLCGHTHGGLVRIPFIGGLIAPNQGFFPKYDKGEFDFNESTMIVSAGLGNSNFLPRINNCAEIMVVDVV